MWKQIIALSTLSQFELIMMILRMGFRMLGSYHLMTHAVFKSVLVLLFVYSKRHSMLWGFKGNYSTSKLKLINSFVSLLPLKTQGRCIRLLYPHFSRLAENSFDTTFDRAGLVLFFSFSKVNV